MKRLRIGRLFLLLVSILILRESNLLGQSYLSFRGEQERIASGSPWKFGPFHIFPRFGLSRVGYDDNIYQRMAEDDRISDYTATGFADFESFFLLSKNIILKFRESPQYIYYVDRKNLRAFNNSYAPELKLLLLNRFVLSGSYQYSKARQRVTHEFNLPADIINRSRSLGLHYETQRRAAIGITVAYVDAAYEDPGYGDNVNFSPQLLDRKERKIQGDFHYPITSDTSFFLNGGYRKYDFEAARALSRDSTAYYANAGFQFPILGRIRGQLSLGYKKLVPEEEGMQAFDGIVGNTNLQANLGRVNLRLTYRRDIPFSIGANLYFVLNEYGTGVSYYFSEYLKIYYDYSYSPTSYPERVPVVLPDGDLEFISRRDSYIVHKAGLEIRLFERTALGISVDYWKRNSTLITQAMDRMFIGGYITQNF